MNSIDPALESIDGYLRQLHQNVGNDEEIAFFKGMIVPDCADPNKYLQLYKDWSISAHRGWEKWKVTHASETDRIREYDDKLKKCDAYLTFMTSILLPKKETEPEHVDPSEKEEKAKMDHIAGLLKREQLSGIRSVVYQENVDKAFELVKTLKFSIPVQGVLNDIFEIYLDQGSLTFFKKAYKIALYKQQHLPDDTYLLDQVVEKCISLRSPQGESFLNQVLQYYPKCNEDLVRGEVVSAFPIPRADTRNPIEDLLIKKGDESAIKGREADQLVERGKFQEAIDLAQTISDSDYRKGVLASLFARCCKIGDEGALVFALHMALQHPEYKTNYLCEVIEACKKNKHEKLAREAARHIEDQRQRVKWLAKIDRFFGVQHEFF